MKTEQRLNEELGITELTADIFVVQHKKPWPANSAVVRMSDASVLMIDTPYTSEATEKVLRWISQQFGTPKITAINTHFHADRLGGDEALRRHGIPVFGSDLTNELFQKEHPGGIGPDKIFKIKDGTKIEMNGRIAEVIYPGPGHTQDNVVVYIPHLKVLFGGCFIIGMPKLGNLKDADLKAWPKSLDRISDLNVVWVIPGHGDRFDRDLLVHTRRLLGEKETTAQENLRCGPIPPGATFDENCKLVPVVPPGHADAVIIGKVSKVKCGKQHEHFQNYVAKIEIDKVISVKEALKKHLSGSVEISFDSWFDQKYMGLGDPRVSFIEGDEVKLTLIRHDSYWAIRYPFHKENIKVSGRMLPSCP